MKIENCSKMSNAEYNVIRADINKALEQVGKKYGVQFKAGNVRVAEGYADFKLQMAIVRADGTVETVEADTFKRLHSVYGFELNQLYQKFVMGGKTYSLMGINTSSSKLPVVIMEISSGKMLKANLDSVKNAMGTRPTKVC